MWFNQRLYCADFHIFIGTVNFDFTVSSMNGTVQTAGSTGGRLDGITEPDAGRSLQNTNFDR